MVSLFYLTMGSGGPSEKVVPGLDQALEVQDKLKKKCVDSICCTVPGPNLQTSNFYRLEDVQDFKSDAPGRSLSGNGAK
jgi:hypothetical protein